MIESDDRRQGTKGGDSKKAATRKRIEVVTVIQGGDQRRQSIVANGKWKAAVSSESVMGDGCQDGSRVS